jgi:hypothetical protein
MEAQFQGNRIWKLKFRAENMEAQFQERQFQRIEFGSSISGHRILEVNVRT